MEIQSKYSIYIFKKSKRISIRLDFNYCVQQSLQVLSVYAQRGSKLRKEGYHAISVISSVSRRRLIPESALRDVNEY